MALMVVVGSVNVDDVVHVDRIVRRGETIGSVGAASKAAGGKGKGSLARWVPEWAA